MTSGSSCAVASRAALFGATLSLFGCAGGQTGSEEWGGGGTTGEGGGCDAHPTELELNVVSPLGFAVADAVANVSGTRAATLEWRSLEPDVALSPENGESSIELSLGADPSSGRFVHYTPNASASGSLGLGCPGDEVAFDAELSFASAGGALAEQRRVVVRATSAEKASISFELPWSEIHGSLTATPRAGLTLRAPRLTTEIDAASVRGTLTGFIEEASGDGASTGARNVTYACWPAGSSECQNP